jgi:O-antigen/teichoic acid export membrane protein
MDREQKGLSGDLLKLMVASVVVGAGNYGFSLTLVWLLPTRQFSQVSSASTLLLVVGTASSAMLPWIVARAVSNSAPGSLERREAVQFSLLAAVVLGLSCGSVMAALVWPYAPKAICGLLIVTSTALFVAGVAYGYQIGARRFTLVAVLNIIEVVVRLGAGIGLVLAGGGATGAFAGFALGALMWAGTGLWFLRHELGIMRTFPTLALLHQLLGVSASQILVTLLSTMDIVVGSLVIGAAGGLAVYQAMVVFSRVPTFVSTAVSGVVYPKLVGQEAGQSQAISEASALYLVLAIVIAATVATLPASLLGLIVPGRYLHSLRLLLPLALAGLAAGQLNVSSTFLQAHLAFRTMLKTLAVALPLVIITYVEFGRTIASLAWSAAGCVTAVALVIFFQTSRRYGAARLATTGLGYVAAFVALYEVLRWAQGSEALWLCCVAAAMAMALLRARPRRRKSGPLRVLFVLGRHRLSTDIELSLLSVRDSLSIEGVEVALAFADRGWAARLAGRTNGHSPKTPSEHRRDGLFRGPLLLWSLHRFQPDLLVEEIRAPFLGAVTPWRHRVAAVAVVAPSQGLSSPRGLHSRGDLERRVLRDYEQVLFVLAERGVLRRRILAAPPSGRDPSSGNSGSTDEFAQLCLAACARAIAERNTGHQLPDCLLPSAIS